MENAEKANYKPDKIKNLKVTLDGEDRVKVDFTATGEVLDYGTGNILPCKAIHNFLTLYSYTNHVASWYELRFANEEEQLFNETTWGQTEIIVNGSILEGSLVPEEAGNPMELIISRNIFNWDKKYYMAIKAYDSNNKSSDLSNIASFKNSNLPQEDNGLSGGAIFGIIFFCIVFIAVCVFVVKIWLNRAE